MGWVPALINSEGQANRPGGEGLYRSHPRGAHRAIHPRFIASNYLAYRPAASMLLAIVHLP
jgi:hypothetical protein